MTYDTENNQEKINEESIQLPKKIAKIEIDDFLSHIIEDIKNTWE
ncbi:hypothetical protein Gotri_012640, partial [Gossypium trilobum]|nr:hypothetical protein [Gossypium trilobum]